MPAAGRLIACVLAASLAAPGCGVTVPPPKPDGVAAMQMPARIDAMFTSRFDIVGDGPLLARANDSLETVVRLAEIETPPFLRLLDSMQPAAYSNGGSVIYLTTGSVLLANDAQLFMMLAHEVAHLEAKNLSSTQYEKAVIRAADAMLTDVREDPPLTCSGDDDEDDMFGPPLFEDEDEDDREFWQVLAGDVLCSVAQGAVSAAVEASLEADRSSAEQRWSEIEGEMDARAFALGRAAGYDQAELMSVFSLLNSNASGVPFLVERTRRLSSIPGIERISIQVPSGRRPVELADRFSGEALDALHALGRNQGLGPESRIRLIQTQASELLQVYGESDAFLRGYYSYLIGYGGAVGIDPALLRRAVDGLAALPALDSGIIGEVWFGCEAIRLQHSLTGAMPELSRYSDRELGTQVRRVLLEDGHMERATTCATAS